MGCIAREPHTAAAVVPAELLSERGGESPIGPHNRTGRPADFAPPVDFAIPGKYPDFVSYGFHRPRRQPGGASTRITLE